MHVRGAWSLRGCIWSNTHLAAALVSPDWRCRQNIDQACVCHTWPVDSCYANDFFYSIPRILSTVWKTTFQTYVASYKQMIWSEPLKLQDLKMAYNKKAIAGKYRIWRITGQIARSDPDCRYTLSCLFWHSVGTRCRFYYDWILPHWLVG